MKALVGLITALSIPIGMLNLFGGIISGIWLAILGKWSPIFMGFLGLLGSTFLLGFALMPGLLFAAPAAKFAEKKIYSGLYFFAFLSSLYTFAVITIWCVFVMRYFMADATEKSYIPLMLWSYGVATGPLGYMASKERDNEASIFTVFFASLAYITAGLWAIFGRPTILDVLVLFGCVMGVGMLTMFAHAVASSKQNEEWA